METTLAEKAIQLVIMDAIEKGHTNAKELAQYMKSEAFRNSAGRYFEMLKKEFN